MRISGCVAIVTGASSGIGEATTRELARRGASVVLAARRAERLERLASDLANSTGRTHLAIQADVSRRADIDTLVQQTVDRFGRIDLLVNNAGIGSGGALLRSSDEAIQQLFAVNVLGPVRTIQATVPHMPRGSVIVNVGSLAGEVTGPGLYVVTKAAVRTFSHGLRPQLAGLGIAVVLVEPGYIRTEMTANSRVPMPGPDVVARAIANAAERPRRTIIVPGWYAPLVLALHLTPSPVLDWVFQRWPRRQRQGRTSERA
jgi:NAD(P)-dependent dehydrogenase (short-subunit alcohol dehydrogenase family)